MTSHEEVALAWRNGRALKGTNMFTDGKTIFSYGSWFPIATKLNGQKILFNKPPNILRSPLC